MTSSPKDSLSPKTIAVVSYNENGFWEGNIWLSVEDEESWINSGAAPDGFFTMKRTEDATAAIVHAARIWPDADIRLAVDEDEEDNDSAPSASPVPTDDGLEMAANYIDCGLLECRAERLDDGTCIYSLTGQCAHDDAEGIRALKSNSNSLPAPATEEQAQRGLNDTWPGDPYP